MEFNRSDHMAIFIQAGSIDLLYEFLRKKIGTGMFSEKVDYADRYIACVHYLLLDDGKIEKDYYQWQPACDCASNKLNEVEEDESCTLCDLCPLAVSVCGPKSFIEEYRKHMNWSIPTIWCKEAVRTGKLISLNKFRQLPVVQRFSNLCQLIAFTDLPKYTYERYTVR